MALLECGFPSFKIILFLFLIFLRIIFPHKSDEINKKEGIIMIIDIIAYLSVGIIYFISQIVNTWKKPKKKKQKLNIFV